MCVKGVVVFFFFFLFSGLCFCYIFLGGRSTTLTRASLLFWCPQRTEGDSGLAPERAAASGPAYTNWACLLDVVVGWWWWWWCSDTVAAYAGTICVGASGGVALAVVVVVVMLLLVCLRCQLPG